MNSLIHSSRWTCNLLALAAAMVLGAGCATNGRYVLLKEYGPTGPTNQASPLHGATICIKPFQCVSNLTSLDPKTQPEEPAQFRFVEFTDVQNGIWDQEFRALKKTTPQAGLREIGSLRNMFGMVMSHIYALNDPGAWLAETLKMDLERQGANVVDASQAESADLCVSGRVEFCRVDAYMKIWGDLIVDLELKPKGLDASHKILHTNGGRVAWVGSTAEFYQPLRECRQKFSWLVMREIANALPRPNVAKVQ